MVTARGKRKKMLIVEVEKLQLDLNEKCYQRDHGAKVQVESFGEEILTLRELSHCFYLFFKTINNEHSK